MINPPQGRGGIADNTVYGLILSDVVANRPAFSIVDRFFWATDEHILYRDTGAAWVKAAVADHPDLDTIGSDDHHTEVHAPDHLAGQPDDLETSLRLTQLSEKAHASLTGVTTDQHHAEDHATRHEDTGGDEIDVGGLSGELADNQPPYLSTTHIGVTAYVGLSVDYLALSAEFANVFYCNGTADNVEINAALTYVGALGGGKVVLLDGIFTIILQIAIASADISLVGQGAGTLITIPDGYDTNINIIDVAADINRIMIADLRIDGNKDNQGAGTMDGIVINTEATEDDDDAHRILHCWIENMLDHGISFGSNQDYSAIIGNHFFENDGAGVAFYGSDWNNIVGNSFYGNKYGVKLYGSADGNVISGNSFDHQVTYGIWLANSESHNVVTSNVITNITFNIGIFLDGCDDCTISTNTITNCRFGIKVHSGSIRNAITGNTVNINNRHGIWVYGANENNISGNSVSLNVMHGIFLENSDLNNISGNTCSENNSGDTATYDGIYIDADSHNNLISSNHCYANDRNGIQSDGDRNSILNNFCIINGDYGIEIGATADSNLVKNNYFYNNTVGMFLDGGTNTRLASKPFQFIRELNGSYLTTSPTGIEIDDDAEGAILQGHLPIEVQQIVRIRIFGVALAPPIDVGGQMHLEITFNAGAGNAAYNTATKSWVLTNFDSEEADYAANDVITWKIEDGDVGDELLNLAALDWFEMILTHEAGADPDGATDAVFGSISIEYV